MMNMPIDDNLLNQIRSRFQHVDHDPISGPRTFLESGGGSLVLNSVLDKANAVRALPDSEGRYNRSSEYLQSVMDQAHANLRNFFGSARGQVIFGSTGTEILSRLIRVVLQQAESGTVLSSSLEHTATSDPAEGWSRKFGFELVQVDLDPLEGTVTPEHYARAVRPDTVLATIIHTSHVTGKRLDLKEICSAIRKVSPDCYIICDGIQHAPHGSISVEESGVDAYVYAPYKAFSGRGGSFAWISDRLAKFEYSDTHCILALNWMLGSSDPAFFAAINATHEYLCWLGGNFTKAEDDRSKIVAAMNAANAHEMVLLEHLLYGSSSIKGLVDLPGVKVLGGNSLAAREGALSFTSERIDPVALTKELERRHIRVYVRDNLPGSSARSTLNKMQVEKALRISFCHYNTVSEISQAVSEIEDIIRNV